MNELPVQETSDIKFNGSIIKVVLKAALEQSVKLGLVNLPSLLLSALNSYDYKDIDLS